MKKLHILILKSFIGPFFLTFFIALFVLLMQFLWKYIDDMVGKGLDLFTIARFMFYTAWTLVPMALPLAVLLSSLMVFGNLGEQYELVAMKAAGISLQKAMTPIIGVCLFICVIAFYFSNYAMPKAFVNYHKLYIEIRTKKPAFNIRQGEYYDKLDGYVIRLGEKKDKGRRLEDIQIYDHTDRLGNTRITTAKSGSMYTSTDKQYLLFDLEDGYTYTEEIGTAEDRQTRPFTRIQFARQQLRFDLAEFNAKQSTGGLFEKLQKGMRLKELEKEIDTLTQTRDQRIKEVAASIMGRNHYLRTYASNDSNMELVEASPVAAPSAEVYTAAFNSAKSISEDMIYYRRDIQSWQERVNSFAVEWHRKFSLSFACLVLFFIGAPLGAIIRKGGLGMPVVLSLIMFIIYYVLNVIGEKSALKGELPIWLGIWMSSLVYLPFGIFLTWKATTDSPILDLDTWRKIFRKS